MIHQSCKQRIIIYTANFAAAAAVAAAVATVVVVVVDVVVVVVLLLKELCRDIFLSLFRCTNHLQIEGNHKITKKAPKR